jgi:inorganic pyrophosphatase
MKHDFWEFLQKLVDTSNIEIDRPMGSTHHRYPDSKYPVDYGFLEGTTSLDAGGVDIWVGSLSENKVVGALCTVDLLKRDTELKIIYDCKDEEIHAIINFVNTDLMQAIYIKKGNKKEFYHGVDT